ncbi:MAG: class I SAM-dependent methyltransferase [Coriobacteriia bacterium]
MVRDRLWNPNIHYHRLILDAIPDDSTRVLDVGCGDGILSADLVGAGVGEVTGLDIDAPVLERACSRHQGLGIHWLHGDVADAPLQPESFDAVVSVAALHHMDATQALGRFAELVRPDGVVAVVGLAANDWWDWPYALFGTAARAVLGFRHGRWEHSAPIVWPPPLTYREVRALGRQVLPGCRFRHLLLGRYALVWRKPM